MGKIDIKTKRKEAVTSAISSGSKFSSVVLPTSKVAGELRYDLYGQSTDPLIVFVHGIGGGSLSFVDVAKGLAASNFQVLTFDFFGRGLSFPPPSNSTYDSTMHVEQIYCLLESLTLLKSKKITICGFSMGGAMVMKFLDTYKSSVDIENVILLDPAGLMDPPSLISFLNGLCCTAVCSLGLDCCTSVLGHVLSTPSEEASRGGFHDQHCESADLLYKTVGEYAQVNDVNRAFFKSVAQVPELFNSHSIVTRVVTDNNQSTYGTKKRFLLIWGENDTVVPMQPSLQRYTDIMVKGRAESFDIRTIPDCGHVVTMEKSQQTLSAILDFLSNKSESNGTMGTLHIPVDNRI